MCPFLEFVFEKFYPHGDDRNEDDTDNDEREMLFDEWDVAKKVPCKGKEKNPDKSTKNVIPEKFSIIHFSYPCHKRGKGADDGDKSSQKNRFPAVFVVKRLCFVNMILINWNPRIVDQFLAKKMSNPIIRCIPEKCCKP